MIYIKHLVQACKDQKGAYWLLLWKHDVTENVWNEFSTSGHCCPKQCDPESFMNTIRIQLSC